jgi:hypothetical protein
LLALRTARGLAALAEAFLATPDFPDVSPVIMFTPTL